MRLAAVTALVMVAFAANSVLNRAGVGAGLIGSLDFALIRVIAGAVVLAGLVAARGGRLWRALRAVNVVALTVYLVGFSLAYLTLPAGAGALVLFGAVQVTMFAGAVAGGERVPVGRWAGAALALAGLGWMLWPGEAGLPLLGGAVMALAGIGWGVYSLRGRAGGAPLETTAASFAGAVPLVGVAWLVAGGGVSASASGIALAVVSGALTSGLGYALWYAVLPSLGATRGALAQLTVPVIAVAGGVVLLGEAVTARLVLSSALVVGGVALGLLARR